MDLKMKEQLQFLPINLACDIEKYLDDSVQEIRFRLNKPVCIMKKSKNIVLSNVFTDKRMIEEIFIAICENSVYAHQDEINQGFVTIKNGSRVGICGTAVVEKGRLISVKNITSLNFRISRDFVGCADEIISNCQENIIIAGPPSSGKTTILRDLARSISNQNKKVCVVDERMEIGGVIGEFDLGNMTDVLRGYKKAHGISLAIRTLSPQTIIFDEIGTARECESVFESLNSGVNIITSVHCNGKEQFLKRPVCRKLLSSGFFTDVVFLGSTAGKIKEFYKISGENLCDFAEF